MHPIGFCFHGTVTLLQEQNIRNNARTGIGKERIVRQTNRTEKVGTLCDVLADSRVLFVHRSRRSDERDDTAGTHLVQGLCKEIVVDQEPVLVVTLIRYTVIAEGNIANSNIEETVGKRGCFISLYNDVGVLIELLCNTSCDAVEFHAVEPAARHAFGKQAEEIADTAGGFKDVACAKAHILNRRIHGLDDRGACIMRV